MDYKLKLDPSDVASMIMKNWEDWLPDVIGTEDMNIAVLLNDTIIEGIENAVGKFAAAMDVILAIKQQIVCDIVAEDRSMNNCISILDNYDVEYLRLVSELLGMDPQEIYPFMDKVDLVSKISELVTNQDIADVELSMENDEE